MARANNSPSRWWFWGPVVGANLYLLALPLLGRILLRARGLGLVFLVLRVLVVVFDLFMVFVRRALTHALGPPVRYEPLTGFAILVLWELAAVVLGMVCYGAALGFYALVSGERGQGEQRDGSR